MANTYTWTVTNIVGYPVMEGETGVVTTVFYTVLADDGEGHISNVHNIQQTPLDPNRPFIPFADLTNDIVIGWVQSDLGESGVSSICLNLDAQIQDQINPPPSPEVLPLPWA